MSISVYTSLLIKDYKRKAGEIKALRKELREIAKVTLTKERELTALEAIIRSREPEFDSTNIQPIATHPKVIGLKWNKLTTLILSCLREANGEIVPSNYITDYVIEQSGMEISDRIKLTIVRHSVKDRLKSMARTGRVVRHHNVLSNGFGLWSLPSSE